MSYYLVGIFQQIPVAFTVWGLVVTSNQDAGWLSTKQLWCQAQAVLHQAALEFGCRLGFLGPLSGIEDLTLFHSRETSQDASETGQSAAA